MILCYCIAYLYLRIAHPVSSNISVLKMIARTLLVLILTTLLSNIAHGTASRSFIHGNIVSRWSSSRRSLPTVIQTSATTSATTSSRRSNVTTQEKVRKICKRARSSTKGRLARQTNSNAPRYRRPSSPTPSTSSNTSATKKFHH